MKQTYQKTILIMFTSLTVTLLVACSSSPSPAKQDQVTAPEESTAEVLQASTPMEDDSNQAEAAKINNGEQQSAQNLWAEGSSQVDQQGAVVVEIVPLNLNAPGNTLDFEVALNTHSVDLSMDLATLATLETDTGQIVQAILWEAPSGGHHVSGILSFPSQVDGFSVIENASKISIIIEKVDAPARVFSWER